ncbi:MAG: type II secretion system F family protein [Clostridia bacterium]|nr:type II secretion system F family protein [Clostridia bacterium]
MEYVVISYALLAFILFVLIAAPFGKRADEKDRRVEMIKGTIDRPEFDELQTSLASRIFGKSMKKLPAILRKIAPKKKNKTKEKSKKLEVIARQLRLAGIFMDPEDFNFIKTVFLVASLVATLIIVMVIKPEPMVLLLVLSVGVLIGIMGPTFYLRSRVNSHQNGIKQQLPDAMDLLCVCIEAGLSFDASLMKVSEKLHGPFIDELLVVYREIQIGLTRREALQHLCDSTTLDELRTFSSALIQAEQLGIPINNVMRSQSEQLRVERSQQAKEKGNKASIKMLIPMLLFIFPVIFIILMGPSVLNIIDTFSS